ncbi:MAG: PEGA domain-containing protein [Kiritimatiellae bacterium]|nr:PEGA domain-containing protein [Kiritimatiellia bacterium]
MKKILSFFFVLTVGFLFANDAAPKRVSIEFKSTPDGAQVFVDGEEKGMTPFVLADVKPNKSCHVRMELDDYEPYDSIFTPLEISDNQVSARLEPVKGIILLTSEPSGASITVNGYSHGETPRLITVLETKDQHSVVLKKTGYLDRKLEIKFNGRRPIVENVKLLLNSGVANITSDPEGAEVVLNGISRGSTPVVVSEIPNGRMTLELKKDGYEKLTREIAINAGDTPNLFYKLNPLPGNLNLSSVPTGARFYINGEPRGDGPVYLKNLTPGTYTVKVEKDGFDSQTREIVVEKGATVNEEFRLMSNLAKLELRTRPAGIEVEIDGRIVGRTKGSGDSTMWSESLIIPNLKAGEHTVRVKCRGYAEEIRHPVLNVSSTTSLKIEMREVFTPNVRIITSTDVIEGILKNTEGSFITVEGKNKIERPIPKENIRKMERLDLQ